MPRTELQAQLTGTKLQHQITFLSTWSQPWCVCSSLNHVQLFATPWTVAHKAPLSMGLSRQEYRSGLPSHLQGIFPTQGSNPGFLHCRQILYHLSHLKSPPGHWRTSFPLPRVAAPTQLIQRWESKDSFPQTPVCPHQLVNVKNPATRTFFISALFLPTLQLYLKINPSHL